MRKRKQADDPMRELHDVRARLLVEAGGTLDGLYEMLRRRQARGRRRLVKLPPKRHKPRRGKVA